MDQAFGLEILGPLFDAASTTGRRNLALPSISAMAAIRMSRLPLSSTGIWIFLGALAAA